MRCILLTIAVDLALQYQKNQEMSYRPEHASDSRDVVAHDYQMGIELHVTFRATRLNKTDRTQQYD
eukprot:m.1522990 g.1522990  ORF g.1522990 m.1522990 type:complete len:66 (+) comp25231_c0_seq3:151-348(+)